MANYGLKLLRLKARRIGAPGIDVPLQSQTTVRVYSQIAEMLAENFGLESYEQRTNFSSTKYALGAMQAVDNTYTEKSVSEGDRIKAHLAKHFGSLFPVEFRYQGSVPLNIHIEGVSDIDLLILRNDFKTYDSTGPGQYVPAPEINPCQRLNELRRECEETLTSRYHATDVDCSGNKSIALSGGSLARKIDVVPAHWYDSDTHQVSFLERDRGIAIYNKGAQRTEMNYPFLHIAKIEEKNQLTNEGAKYAIRLLKNLKADSPNKSSILLSSYDIAGLVWNAPVNILSVTICYYRIRACDSNKFD
ncbi:hypothetical protein NBRC3280_3305 [Acetobacter pasteurianus NBRC 3280]|uniref:cGAS/DncV-like nucleotidyltransferase C-terminal helical domain-containing protein n=1 Tax=Acetobacter pasteurianus NBRC 3278 TaxID=1226660 RepID=A0A401X8T9_ACEPA|nr:hypothetical protein [Acetobacter pasteurianus]GCD60727.1 hypothetical protein NBRC3277_3302 [Acetobacter pasteurianus NBRC 3277]GCD64315.1 hypothetical protein NBRC3278_3408 [Acetobacter pasteurianus NBRC 3278]GCD70670.1 hypothetical protein NBRC3280_3305 [Acetobacter pasteurianus NBRC 3280]